MARKLIALLTLSLVSLMGYGVEPLSQYRWEMLSPSGTVSGRHENAFIEFEDKFYLLGGRGVLEVGVYDPQTNSWEQRGKTPIEINHFQAVIYGEEIYIVGAMNGRYPIEEPLRNVWIYHPDEDRWEMGDEIPAEHQRGGAGSVCYNGKIYVVCGIEYGHTSGTTNIFSCYDPKSGEWTTLTKAPHVRDHFAAIVVEEKLYCIGGRNSSVHTPDNFAAFFSSVVGQVDVYDFASEKWHTLPNKLPVPTAAGGVAHINNCIVYMGGEGIQPLAYSQTQCLDLESGKWSQLAPMVEGMHGSSAIEYNGDIYWAAGSYKKGGSNLNTLQKFSIANTEQ